MTVVLPALIPPEAMARLASQVPSTPPPATLSAGVVVATSWVRSDTRENPYVPLMVLVRSVSKFPPSM